MHKLCDWKSMKFWLYLLWQLAVLYVIETEKRTKQCRQQANAIIIDIFDVCGVNICNILEFLELNTFETFGKIFNRVGLFGDLNHLNKLCVGGGRSWALEGLGAAMLFSRSYLLSLGPGLEQLVNTFSKHCCSFIASRDKPSLKSS